MLESVTRNVSVSSTVPLLPRRLARPRAPNEPPPAPRTRELSLRPDNPDRARPHPLRRQPAEGRPRPLAAARLPGAAAGRADPRRGRRRPRRAVRRHPPARRRRPRRPARLQRSARGPRPRRPCAGAPRGPRRAHGPRPGARRAPRTRPRHGREPGVHDAARPTPTRPGTDADAHDATRRRTDAPPATRSRRRPSHRWRGIARADVRTLSLLGVLAALVVVGGITKPDEFLDTRNLQLVLTQASVIGVVTVGMTFVIIGGGIDLSVGAIVALASVWATTVATQEYGFARHALHRGDRRRGLRPGQRAAHRLRRRWCRSSPPSPCSPRRADSPCRSPTARRRSSPSSRCWTSASRDAYVLGIPPLVLVFAAVTVARLAAC